MVVDLSHRGLKVLHFDAANPDTARTLKEAHAAVAGVRTLKANDNFIASVHGAGMFTNLRILELANNRITSLSASQLPMGLRTLIMPGNLLTSIAFVGDLQYLQHLDVSRNALRALSLVTTEAQPPRSGAAQRSLQRHHTTAPLLSHLFAADNAITSLAGVAETFPELTILDLRRNEELVSALLHSSPADDGVLASLDRLAELHLDLMSTATALYGASDDRAADAVADAIERIGAVCALSILDDVDLEHPEQRRQVSESPARRPDFLDVVAFSTPPPQARTQQQQYHDDTTSRVSQPSASSRVNHSRRAQAESIDEHDTSDSGAAEPERAAPAAIPLQQSPSKASVGPDTWQSPLPAKVRISSERSTSNASSAELRTSGVESILMRAAITGAADKRQNASAVSSVASRATQQRSNANANASAAVTTNTTAASAPPTTFAYATLEARIAALEEELIRKRDENARLRELVEQDSQRVSTARQRVSSYTRELLHNKAAFEHSAAEHARARAATGKRLSDAMHAAEAVVSLQTRAQQQHAQGEARQAQQQRAEQRKRSIAAASIKQGILARDRDRIRAMERLLEHGSGDGTAEADRSSISPPKQRHGDPHSGPAVEALRPTPFREYIRDEWQVQRSPPPPAAATRGGVAPQSPPKPAAAVPTAAAVEAMLFGKVGGITAHQHDVARWAHTQEQHQQRDDLSDVPAPATPPNNRSTDSIGRMSGQSAQTVSSAASSQQRRVGGPSVGHRVPGANQPPPPLSAHQSVHHDR